MAARKSIILLHTVIASFFLPVGLMFAITGGFYSVGITGNYKTSTHEIRLDAPLGKELGPLVTLVEAELGRLGVDVPSGAAKVQSGGTSFHLVWSGSRRDVELHPTTDPLVASLRVKETTVHRFFVQLHKAKGGEAFKWFAVSWMVGTVILLATGTMLALAIPAYRKPAIVSLVIGTVALAVLSWVS